MSNVFTTVNTSVSRVDISKDGTHDTEYMSNEFTIAPNGDILFDAREDVIEGSGQSFSQYYVKDAVTGAVSMVSTDSTGTPSNDSISPSISLNEQLMFTSDSNKVLMSSSATNLNLTDTDIAGGFMDVFLKDLTTGDVELITDRLYDTGHSPTMSPDDNLVAFNAGSTITIKDLNTNVFTTLTSTSGGPKLFSPDSSKLALNSAYGFHVAGDTNGVTDAFLYDIATGTYERVSTDSSGNQANGLSGFAFFSPNGNEVFFNSFATNLVPFDTNGKPDLFRKDLTTGDVTRVATDSNGAQMNTQLIPMDISSDGSKILFYSFANGFTALWVKDLVTDELFYYQVDGLPHYDLGMAQFSPDDSQIYFISQNGFDVNDTNAQRDIYAFDLNFPNSFVAADCAPVTGTIEADQVTVSDDHSYEITVLAGDDYVIGGVGHDTIDAGADNDTVYGGLGHDSITGGSGDDELRGMEGHDTISGGDGNDLIYAGIEAQRDTIDGGAGDDTIHAGGAGDDLLTGGSGADVFMFMAAGTEATILDFDDGVDKIDVSDFAVGLSRSHITFYDDQLSGLTALVASGGDEMHIHLSGFSVATNPLDATDFIF